MCIALDHELSGTAIGIGAPGSPKGAMNDKPRGPHGFGAQASFFFSRLRSPGPATFLPQTAIVNGRDLLSAYSLLFCLSCARDPSHDSQLTPRIAILGPGPTTHAVIQTPTNTTRVGACSPARPARPILSTFRPHEPNRCLLTRNTRLSSLEKSSPQPSSVYIQSRLALGVPTARAGHHAE